LVKLLVAAGVVLFPLPALVLGARGLMKRPGYSIDEPADRPSYVLLVALRALVLLLVFALSVVVLVSTIGAAVVDVPLHGMVYVFFGLDVLLALLVVVSFGRRVRRPVRRRVTPAVPSASSRPPTAGRPRR
jgi:type IV secretory pathway VirB3-like protein